MTEWIQKYVDHLSTKKTHSEPKPRLSREGQQLFEAKQKIQLYMMRGSPDLDDTEPESSGDDDDYNDFIKDESADDSIKDSGFIENFVQNKDALPNKVDRMLLPLFTEAGSNRKTDSEDLTSEPASQDLKSQSDSLDSYAKFGALSAEASKVQIIRRNTMNDDLKNIFKVMNEDKASPSVLKLKPNATSPSSSVSPPKSKKTDDSVKSSLRAGALYNTLQAEFVKSQYRPRWTESTTEMINEASQTELFNLPQLSPVGSNAPPNSIAHISEQHINEPSTTANSNNVRILLEAAKEKKANKSVGDEVAVCDPGVTQKQKTVNDDLKELFKLIKVKDSTSQTYTTTESLDTSNESIRISVGSSITNIYDTLNAEFQTLFKPKWVGSSLESVQMSHQPSQTEQLPSPCSDHSQDRVETVRVESDPQAFPSLSTILQSNSDETPFPMWTESRKSMDQHDNSQTEIMTNKAVYRSNLSIDSMPWVPFPSQSTSLNENSLRVHLSGASSIVASSLDSSRGRSLADYSKSSVSTQTESRRILRIVSRVKRRGSRHRVSKESPPTSRHHRVSNESPPTSRRHHRDAKGSDSKPQGHRRHRDSIEVHNIRKSQHSRRSMAAHDRRQVTKFVERVIANAVGQEELDVELERSSCTSSSYPDTISIDTATSQDLVDDLVELEELEDGKEDYSNTELNSAYQKFKELIEVRQAGVNEAESPATVCVVPKLNLKEEEPQMPKREVADTHTAKPTERNVLFWDRVKQPLLETISPRINGNMVVVNERLKPGMLHMLYIRSFFNHPGIVVEECWLYWRVTAVLTYGSVECDGRISVGDVIFAVNGLSVRGLTKGRIRQLFYQCSKQEEYSISILAFDERWGGHNGTMAHVRELLTSKDMASLTVTSHPAPTHAPHNSAHEPRVSDAPAVTPRTAALNVKKMDLDVFIKNAFYTGPNEFRSGAKL